MALRQLMDSDKDLTTTSVARSVGMSTATISQWLNHKYNGDVEKVCDAVKKFIDLYHDRKASRQQGRYRKPAFVQTSVSTKIFEVAKLCQIDGDIGVAIGEPGIGKTVSVEAFAAQNSGVILLEADPGMPVKACFAKMQRQFGGDGYGTAYTLFEDVLVRLNNSGRLIVIDEAEHLPHGALELLRRLHDKAGVGILLVGSPVLLGKLRGCRGQYTQLYSRVGVLASLKPINAADAEAIAEAALPGVGHARTLHEKTLGNARKLNKLAKRSSRISELNALPIDATVIEAAMTTLLV